MCFKPKYLWHGCVDVLIHNFNLPIHLILFRVYKISGRIFIVSIKIKYMYICRKYYIIRFTDWNVWRDMSFLHPAGPADWVSQCLYFISSLKQLKSCNACCVQRKEIMKVDKYMSFFFIAMNSVHFCSITHRSNQMHYFYYIIIWKRWNIRNQMQHMQSMVYRTNWTQPQHKTQRTYTLHKTKSNNISIRYAHT